MTRCSTTLRSSAPSGCSSTRRPATRARRRSRRPRRRRPPAGPGAPGDVQPGHGDAAARARRRHRQVRPRTPTSSTARTTARPTTTRSCSRRRRTRPTRSEPSSKGQWADVKVTIQGGALDGQDRRHAGQGRGAHRRPVAGPPVPHVRQPRDRDAGRRGPASPASPATSPSTSPRSSRPRPRPTSPSSRPASRARRRTSSRACTGRPATCRCSSTSSRSTSRTCCWSACRRPTSSSTSSSASSRRSCRAAPANPAYDDVDLNGVADGRVSAARGLHPHGLRGGRRDADPGPEADGQGPDDVRRLRPRLRAAVPGDRRQPAARRAGAAVEAADLELPAGDRRDDRQGQGLLGRRRRPDLPQRRGPRSRRRRRSPRSRPADVAATVAAIKATYLGLADPNDWTHDGQPEGWKVIDRAFTKAEARYIPNGPGSTTDMAHPTRTGDVVAFSYPPYQFDAETPGHAGRAVALLRPARLRARTSRTSPPTSTCGRRSWPAARASTRARSTARTIDLAPTLAYLLGVPEPQHSQGRVLLDVVKGGDKRQADLDHRAQRLPRPARPDDARLRRHQPARRRRARSSRRCSTRSSPRCPGPG